MNCIVIQVLQITYTTQIHPSIKPKYWKTVTIFTEFSDHFQSIYSGPNLFPQTNTHTHTTLTQPIAHISQSMISVPLSTVNDLVQRIQVYELFFAQMFANNPSLNISNLSHSNPENKHFPKIASSNL